jgi:hypothetical protein
MVQGWLQLQAAAAAHARLAALLLEALNICCMH